MRLGLFFAGLVVLSSVGCTPPSPLLAPLTPPITPKEQEAILAVQLAVQISDSDGESIWPGFHVAEVPILIFRPGARSFLMMAPPQMLPSFATPVSFDGLDLPAWVLPSSNVPTSQRTPFSQDFPLGSLRVFLVRHDDSSTRDGFFRLVVHERFHHYQVNAFAHRQPPETCRFPYEDIPHAELIRAEERLLSSLLSEPDEDLVPEAILRYFALRRQRYETQGGAKARSLELWEETTEGTARYVEECFAIEAGFSTKQGAKATVASYLAGFEPRSLQKWRYYRTGIAVAFGLDELDDVDWKVACTEGPCLFAFVLQKLGDLLDEVPKDQLERDGILPESERITVKARMAKYLADEQTLLDAWKSQGTHRVQLSLAAPSHGYYSAHGVTFSLPDCSRMVTGVGAYVDRGFRLEVLNRSIRMVNRPGMTMLEFFLDLTPGAILVDGQPLNDGNSSTRFIRSLDLAVPNFEIHLSGCGLVEAADQALLIRLDGLPDSPKCP